MPTSTVPPNPVQRVSAAEQVMPVGKLAELASVVRPSVLRLTRVLRNQRVDTSVTLTQLSVLGALHVNGPMGAGELAAYEKVQPPSMTKVLAALEERALITRVANPDDRRQITIAIAVAGEQLLDDERQRRNEWLIQQLEKLTAHERALLREVIPVLDKLAQS